MKLFRLTVKLRSTLVTPLAADTLFGHWCWHIRNTQGEDALRRELERFNSPAPPFRLSSGFQRTHDGMPTLPMPVWTQPPARTPHDIKHVKRVLRTPLVPFDTLIGAPVTLERLIAALENDDKPLPAVAAQPVRSSPPAIRVRNTVNRTRGGTLDAQGFFEVTPLKAGPDALFDIYFDVPSDRAEQLKDEFTAFLNSGFGQDASTGAGFFDFHSQEEIEFPEPSSPAWLALSPFIPAPDDPPHIFYSLATKYGKLGGLFALSSFNNNIPWKKPLLMMQPGALAFSPSSPRGSIIPNVHPTLPAIHYALCLAVPIDVPGVHHENAMS